MQITLARARAVLFALICGSSLCFAASLQISPVSIQLHANEAGQVINLRNAGDQAIHAQVRVFTWDQANDEDHLEPTRDLLASPPIAEVPAGGAQVIRLIRTGQETATQERAYRLLIDELPTTDAASQGVQFRFRYSVPLFVEPDGSRGTFDLSWSIIEKNGQPFLRVANSGTVHARLSAVSLEVNGASVPIAAGLLGYVLPGRARVWPLTGAARGNAREVSATVNGSALKASLTPAAR
ncbi:molecular chaperone [Caballeronia sp. Lep1P3]|uniref:fimbrial biogenesis chaperone n=1 Tax=Caballeronia sp. Lep1P3 TaxID=2878150 RepID=UPI001FD29D4A|nr:molecular chaperone [Caballeronia sp. Lep1P3]